MKNKDKILFVIPAYNEAENIDKVLKEIKKDVNYADILVINDCSKDNTKEIVEKNNVKCITNVFNMKYAMAVQTGIKYAYQNDYDYVIQFDADGQHDADSINDLIKPIMDGKADFTIGSRFVGNKSKFKSTKTRQLGINLISFEIKLFSKENIKDVTSGFRAANKDIIKKFAYEYPSEYPEPISNYILLKEGYNVKEISVKMHERKAGKSSIGSWKNIYYMFNVMLSIFIEKLRRK